MTRRFRNSIFLSTILLLLFASLLSSPARAADMPDLVVTDVLIEPAQPYSGDVVTFKAIITNQGNAPTPANTVIGGVFELNGQVVVYTDTFKDALPAGASTTLTANGGGAAGNGTWVAQEGTYTVGFLVDDVNRIIESNETNNRLTLAQSITVPVRQGPDLTLTDLTWSPEKLREGKHLTFSASILNQGNQPVPAGTAITIQFTVDGQVVGRNTTFTAGLAPGESTTLASTTRPWRATQGNHIVAADVDAAGQIEETNENNNALPITFAIAQSWNITARPADSFVDSIGVATHLSYYDTPYGDYEGLVKPRLQEAGIRHIRDGACFDETEKFRRLNDLATIGIKSTMIAPPTCLTPEQAVQMAKTLKNSLEMMEGPNEPNIFNRDLFPDQIRIYQEQLYNALKGDPETASLPVLAPSLAYGMEDAPELGPVACDLGNMHPYQGGQLPDVSLESNFQASDIVCPGQAAVATETGYNTAINATSGQQGVSEEAVGKYIPRMYLDFFNAGVIRTFAYEFIDEFVDPDMTNPEARFGMIRRDGTPKPSFYAVKHLISLLQDPGEQFTPGTLDLTISGNTSNLRHTLLQKRDGTYYLVLWSNTRVYDLAARTDITVPAQSVTLEFDQRFQQANTYHPVQSTNPVTTNNKPKSLTVDVLDEPVVIELKP